MCGQGTAHKQLHTPDNQEGGHHTFHKSVGNTLPCNMWAVQLCEH